MSHASDVAVDDSDGWLVTAPCQKGAFRLFLVFGHLYIFSGFWTFGKETLKYLLRIGFGSSDFFAIAINGSIRTETTYEITLLFGD
jgi:hypothetical protein